MKGNFPTPNIFSEMKGLVFAFSSTLDGDMRDGHVREQFVATRSMVKPSLVIMGQVHGTRVQDVSEMNETLELPHTDGIVRKARVGEPPVFVGVRVADCVPIFAVDSKTRIYGVAHAGWKGVLGKVTVNLLQKMKSLGAEKSNIRIFVGPHICPTCYSVQDDRARRFLSAYSTHVVKQTDKGNFLDLAKAIRTDCLAEGIPEDHMETSEICTSCGRWPSFSYRKNKGVLEGEMMGILGFV